MRNTGLYEVQTGIKLAPRNINKYKHADDTTLRTEKMEDLKSLDASERESEKMT